MALQISAAGNWVNKQVNIHKCERASERQEQRQLTASLIRS